MKLGLTSKGVTNAFIQVFAPSMLAGIIEEQVEGKSVKEFYEFIEGDGFWGKIQPSQQNFLVSHKPWDLKWLDVNWLIKTIDKSNRAIAYTILASEELQTILGNEIAEIKERLS